MKKDKKSAASLVALAKGQFWKLDDSYLLISELGKRLVHYKMMKQPGQKAAKIHTMGIETLADILKTRKALLLPSPSA